MVVLNGVSQWACEEIITLVGNGTYSVSGEMMAKVWVDSDQPVQYVKRHYQITPAENRETSTAFTQQDFTDFNDHNPTRSTNYPLTQRKWKITKPICG